MYKEYMNIQTSEELDLDRVSTLSDNAMLKVRPELWCEWDFEKNSRLGLNVYEVTKGSKKISWWICSACRSNYDIIIQNKMKSNTCPYCKGKRVNHTNSLSSKYPDISIKWHPTKNGDLTPHDFTYGSHNSVWWICEYGHEYKSRIDAMTKYNSCSICNNYKLLRGVNDMWTTNPKLASLLADPEDGYRYMQSVSKKVDWKCDKCGAILRNKSINNVNKQGLCCNVCNDSMSFGEKIVYQILTLNNIKFLYNKAAPFSNNLRYDFIIKDYNLIIETHGLQHYKDTGFHKLNGKTKEEEYKNDQFKKQIAHDNGYTNYFEINCSKSDYLFIKKNVIDSGLTELLNIPHDSFNKINIESSLVTECWDLWYNKKMQKQHIANVLGIGRNRVSKYIKLKEHIEYN